MQNADTAKTYCPLRHEIHINMHFVFFNENEYEVCVFLTCYLSFSYFTIHVCDIFDADLKDFLTELHIDFRAHRHSCVHSVLALLHLFCAHKHTHTQGHRRERHTHTNFMQLQRPNTFSAALRVF